MFSGLVTNFLSLFFALLLMAFRLEAASIPDNAVIAIEPGLAIYLFTYGGELLRKD